MTCKLYAQVYKALYHCHSAFSVPFLNSTSALIAETSSPCKDVSQFAIKHTTCQMAVDFDSYPITEFYVAALDVFWVSVKEGILDSV